MSPQHLEIYNGTYTDPTLLDKAYEKGLGVEQLLKLIRGESTDSIKVHLEPLAKSKEIVDKVMASWDSVKKIVLELPSLKKSEKVKKISELVLCVNDAEKEAIPCLISMYKKVHTVKDTPLFTDKEKKEIEEIKKARMPKKTTTTTH